MTSRTGLHAWRCWGVSVRNPACLVQAEWQLGATRLTQHFRSLQSRRQQLEAELAASSSSSQAHQAEGAVEAVPLQRMKELWASLQVA